MEVSQLQTPVQRQGRDNLRGFSSPFAEVAPGFMDASQLQEWYEQLGTASEYRRYSENRMVHAASFETGAES